MIAWSSVPFFRAFIFLACGILLFIYGVVDSTSFIVALCFGATLIVTNSLKKIPYAHYLATPLLIIGLGGSLASWNDYSNGENFITSPANVRAFSGSIISQPKEGSKSTQAILLIDHVWQGSWVERTAKVKVFFKGGRKDHQRGDNLVIQSNLELIPAPTNPDEFDYKTFLSYKQIDFRSFIDPEAVVSKKHQGFSLFLWGDKCRFYLEQVIRDHLPDKQSQEIASALLLGMRAGLDDTTQRVFGAVGANHVLAVSGLHVAILLHLLTFPFRKKLKERRNWRWLYFPLIALLWCYAIVTGFSPSVVRSATMITCIFLAKIIGREGQIINTLALSACVLLVVDPFMIMHVGFQLSYAAVLGIVLLFNPIYKSIVIKSKVGDSIWQLCCVSVAAQIGTFPIALLYFHEFPPLFLVSNLVVIPAAYLVLSLGMVLFATHWIPWIGDILGAALNFVLQVVYKVLETLQSWPYTSCSEIDISVFQTITLYSIILLLGWGLIKKRTSSFKFSLLPLSLLLVLQWHEDFSESHQHELVIYNTPSLTSIDFIDGNSDLFIADSALLHDESKLQFHVKHHWWRQGVVHHRSQLPNHNTSLYWCGQKIYILDNPDAIPEQLEKSTVILRKGFGRPDLKSNGLLRAEKIVFDSSYRPWQCSKIQNDFKAHLEKLYFVPLEGAYVLKSS